MTAALADRAATHGRVAIDTEFVSERRYQALLCLAQVAVPDPDAPDGVRTEVLDPLADDPPDPAPLARVLADPAVEVVVHAGRQDIAILRRTWKTEVTGVFDTQLAAGFIGFGNQQGYESLVRKVLGVKLKGAEGFTRWDRRPLTPQQLNEVAEHYAPFTFEFAEKETGVSALQIKQIADEIVRAGSAFSAHVFAVE